MEEKYIIEDHRIYREDNGKLIAEITFPMKREGVVNFNHTFVDPLLRGQGEAANLVNMALVVVKEKGWKAVATCPYVVRWVKENPEFAKDFID